MEQFGILTLGSRLKRLSDFLFSEVQQVYSDFSVPISSTYFPILRQLQASGAMSVVELAEKLSVSHPAISKQITKMLTDELVEKVADKSDQRRTALVLSNKGKLAMAKAEPVLTEMKTILDNYANFSSSNFLEALEKIEADIFAGGLAEKVLDRVRQVKVVPFDMTYHRAFRDLNMAWLKRFFPKQIAEHDYDLLDDPKKHILDQGGTIFVALGCLEKNEKVLGVVAVLPQGGAASLEMMKLAVLEHCQGMGIAQQLIDKVVDHAYQMKCEKIVLETASSLEAAGYLYHKNGFVEVKPPKPSLFKRADKYMEKNLLEAL